MRVSNVELVHSEDPAWDDRLEAVAHDIYHRARYHRFAERSEGERRSSPFSASSMAGGLVWPYLLRPVADVSQLADAEGFDVASVYGYPGPLAWGCQPGDAFIRKAADALVELWRNQGALTGLHPLSSTPQERSLGSRLAR